jgi:hypothetical protein
MVLNYIPYIGPACMALMLLAVGLVTFPTLGYALLPPAAFVALTTLEGHIITPTVLGRSLTLNPLAVFLALAFWTWMWGPMGAFLAVPLLIVALVIVSHVFPSDDVKLPGQTYAAFVRSPHAHARVRRVDLSRAKSVHGVVAAYTGKDLAAGGVGPLPCGWLLPDLKIPEYRGVATDKVNFVPVSKEKGMDGVLPSIESATSGLIGSAGGLGLSEMLRRSNDSRMQPSAAIFEKFAWLKAQK